MKKLLLLIFLLLCFDLYQYAQDGESKNDIKFKNYGFATLISNYENQLEKNPDLPEIRYRLAISYAKTGQIESSLLNYNILLFSGNQSLFKADDWNAIAHFNLALGKTIEAYKSFDKLSKFNIHFRYQNKPIQNTYYEAKPIESINTPFSEFSPVIFTNGIVFSSDRSATPYDVTKSDWTNTSYLSLFSWNRANSKLDLYAPKLSEGYHMGPASFTADEKTMYYTRAFKENKSGLNYTKIYVANLKDGQWKSLGPILLSQSKNFSVAHPVFIEELNILVFSSNMEGTLGEMDLFYCEKKENGWSTPINFGGKVNTPFNEVFPCYNKFESNALYFSSNGHLGFGGLDVFKIEFSDKRVSSVELLPKSINSNYDDFGIAFESETKGFISSNRKFGKGADDIYAFELTNLVTVSGILVDEINSQTLPNKKLYLLDDKGIVIDSILTDNSGFFLFTKLPYQAVSLLPEDEDGVEMIIRPREELHPKDPFVNLTMLSSKGMVLDSICLAQTQMITYVLESANNIKKRCAVYENGEKAVMIAFNVKNSNGIIIDQLVTDKEGCFIIKKLYPEKTYLELIGEEETEMTIRFLDPKDEKNTNWQNEKTKIILTSPRRCVVYEDGTKAVQINFAVKDSTGTIIDLITTDEEGCFPIRKLYGQQTYLDLLEEEIALLGLRFMNVTDERNVNWQKDSNQIILHSANKCVVYQNDKRAVMVNFELKNNEGLVLDKQSTDENGCFKIRKMYGDDSYLELIDEQNNTLKARLQSKGKDGIIVLEKVETSTNIVLTGKIINMRNLGKDFSEIKIVFYTDEGIVQKVSTVNSIGEFTYFKLPSNTTLLMMIEDEKAVLQGSENIKIKGEITPYATFSKSQIDKNIYVVDQNQEKFTSTPISTSGKFELDINVKNYKEASSLKDVQAFEEIGLTKENAIIIKNIYFERGKWNLNIEAEKIIDELVLVLRKYPKLKVTINAHTDCRGTASDNLSLSKNRAQSVSTYLNSKGIKSSQFLINSYGESKLLNQCKEDADCSEEDHAKNRRIEFEFIWK